MGAAWENVLQGRFCGKNVIEIKQNQMISRTKLMYQLVQSLYSRTTSDLSRGNFRVLGDIIDIFPGYADTAYKIHFFGNEIEFNTVFAQLHGEYLTDTEADIKKTEFSSGLETNYVSVMKEIDSVNEQFRETVERLIN